MKTVFTGWRTVTPGPCSVCGYDNDWECDGRGNIYCSCQYCPDCLEEPGWHSQECTEKTQSLAAPE